MTAPFTTLTVFSFFPPKIEMTLYSPLSCITKHHVGITSSHDLHFFYAVQWGSHKKCIVNISMLYLQINKLLVWDGAIKSLCSYCLLLYYIPFSGSTILLLQMITFSSWPHYMIWNMTGLNFMQWLASSKMPQGAHCCATEGRWGRGLEGRGGEGGVADAIW